MCSYLGAYIKYLTVDHWGHNRKAREIRRGRCEEPSGRSERGAEGICATHWGPGSLLSYQASPLTSKALPSGHTGPEGIEGRPGRSGEAGRRGPPRLEQQERKGGHLPHPLEPRKPAGLPGEVPCPLRPGVGGTPGSFRFLEPKPHPLCSQGLFQPCGS